MSKTALTKPSRLDQRLQKAETFDEVKAVVHEAEALRVVCKKIGQSLEKQNDFAEIKLRAERKAGKMLRESAESGDRAGKGRPKKPFTVKGFSPPTLKETGITEIQSFRWQCVESISEEDFDEKIQEIKDAGEELTEVALLRIARRAESDRRNEELKARIIQMPAGKFSCIVVDPPWPMERIDRDLYPNKTRFDYPTMTEEELCAEPVPDFAADDCHLYLWTTHRFLPMALRLAEHWGFKYQCLMTWVKNEGMVPYSWMYSTEHVLFCRRGNLPLDRLGLRLDFFAKKTEHSRKPDEFYELVRQASPGPRLEMYSREARDGFEQHGIETDKFQE